jgi:hypothetical protein
LDINEFTGRINVSTRGRREEVITDTVVTTYVALNIAKVSPPLIRLPLLKGL